ncbi:MAG: TrmB family transcriptional regulator [Candidatus Thorarchaeota archaeon]|nr:MAG: TrmB family transcriptional regulator [Candidatus Thorarchaeota archaeon]
MMSVSEATLKALKQLGLTEYETQAYLALVGGGQMGASDISAKSKVPYSRIYDVLGRLEEKQFIQVKRGRPTIYVAKSPTEVVRVIRLDWEQKLEDSSKLVVEELQPLFEQETKVTTRDVYVMHGRAAILSKAVEMLESTKEEVLLSIPGLDLDIEDLAAVTENVLAVKAHTRILTSSVPDSVKPLIPSNFEVRTRERVFGVGLVVDERQTLIMLAGGNSDTEFLGIYSSASLFASMARAYFESLWTDSSPL